MDQKKMPLVEALRHYSAEGAVSMHIPGHKNGKVVEPDFRAFFGEAVFKADVSEVHGLDDLHQAEGVILEAQKLAAEAWGADESFFLVNGTTSGIIAVLTAAASDGDKIIIPRNAHKSVFMALMISGGVPIYIQPIIDDARGIIGGLSIESVEEAFRQNPDTKAIYVINPTYYGLCSDLEKIVAIAHSYGASVIADEAHGAHMYFTDRLPKGALVCGADAAAQSTHNMAGSFTQSSMLHIKSGSFDSSKLKTSLAMMQSTSPSYLLMASLDAARCQMAVRGKILLDGLIDLAEAAQLELAKIHGIECLNRNVIGHAAITDFEPLRFIISARKLGINGYDLYEKLYSDYKIEAEFADYLYCILLLGPGSRAEDIEKLISAVKDISKNNGLSAEILAYNSKLPQIPPMIMKPRAAFLSKKEKIPWEESIGRITAEMIIPYPPGIPVICSGEIITAEVWAYLEVLRKDGRHLHGPADAKLDFIEVVI